MKKILLLLLLPVALYCNGKPKIEFESPSHDFGKQTQNQELKHVFVFKNSGDATLVIDRIVPG